MSVFNLLMLIMKASEGSLYRGSLNALLKPHLLQHVVGHIYLLAVISGLQAGNVLSRQALEEGFKFEYTD
ncbi:hypothetical protein VNO77_25420 [Canavalia gladiata]|uniref:Uncharacterized protein n=1 Tax=Canavalia gladiata TaxID=3824 RepID=A0AAN9QDI5_CANGL